MSAPAPRKDTRPLPPVSTRHSVRDVQQKIERERIDRIIFHLHRAETPHLIANDVDGYNEIRELIGYLEAAKNSHQR